ncbi:metal ABC transporter permease [Halomarina ordinaria]|uniref:Metal ABC transporter permease n=1 Tax=Halomarina ordinaria TaxID=3033939 RepID=A0ABD5UCC0_9EURY|nr:metal ABC transporter permease [Halomarina sp. PSRA2]
MTGAASLSPSILAVGLLAEGLFDWLLGLFGGAACTAGRVVVGGDVFCAGYMQQALLAGLCIGVIAPLIGTFLVHRRLAFIGETLAHTAFAGVAIGLVVGTSLASPVSPYVAALVVAVGSALLVQAIAEYTDAYGDVAMAIVLFGGFALGTVIMSLDSGGLSVGIRDYLFGSLSLVTRANVGLLVVLTATVVGTVAVTYRQLLYVTFDETAARVAGVNVRRYERLLVVLTALVVVAAMQIMGVILVAAMLVVPVAAAAQVATSFRQSLALAVVVAEVAVVAGIVVSYYFGLQESGIIVLVTIAGFVLAAGAAHLGVPERAGSLLAQVDDRRTR